MEPLVLRLVLLEIFANYSRVEDLESEPNFEPIGKDGEPLIEWPDEVVRIMSTDSQVCQDWPSS